MPRQADSESAVDVRGLSKTFYVPHERSHTLKERVLHPMRTRESDAFRALQDISFNVKKGGFFGIAGRNGSGKSTLLMCLAGIYGTDTGVIRIDGTVSTFIELGVGFNPDLAAQDNIAINAAMLGLSKREAKRRFDAIIDFAELQDFTELKLKNYSSGMMVRLAFAVMLEIRADILLIDEVLAVGDAAFQQKCFDEFEAIRASNRTVLLVTHDMGAVQRFCDQAILLEHGRTVAAGDPQMVGDRYLDLNFSKAARERAAGITTAKEDGIGIQSETSIGDGSAVIEHIWFDLPSRANADTLNSGATASERPCFVMQVRFAQTVINPVFSVTMRNSHGVPLLVASSDWTEEETGSFANGDVVLWKVWFDNLLGPDRYSVTPSVKLAGGRVLALNEEMGSVVVTRSATTAPMVDIPYESRVMREGPFFGNGDELEDT